jgi:anthranilate phosphoribosyltransferase
MEPIAQTLKSLGSSHVWVVHGEDGLDELTTTGPTHVVELKNGAITRFTVSPGDAGLKTANIDDLKGGDPAVNATALKGVLEGARNAYRDIAVLNAAAGLLVAGKAPTLMAAARMAEAAIDDGRGLATLSRLIAVSNG